VNLNKVIAILIFLIQITLPIDQNQNTSLYPSKHTHLLSFTHIYDSHEKMIVLKLNHFENFLAYQHKLTGFVPIVDSMLIHQSCYLSLLTSHDDTYVKNR
jgi:hypothetical protein